MIDTHAHIFGHKFIDIEEVVRLFKQEGVDKVVMPNIDHSSIDDMLEVESMFPDTCFSTMGLHPTSVGKDFEKELYVVADWLGRRKFTAIGEIGTDLYWEDTYWEHQQEAFKIQCAMACENNLPVIIHCRESIDETIQLIEDIAEPRLTGVFHCFTGDKAQAEKIISLGFYLGIGGVLTFKNSSLVNVINEIGMDKLVLETDSPYLAPVPNRGKRNTPANLVHIVNTLAVALGVTTEQVKEHTTKNAIDLFGFDDEL